MSLLELYVQGWRDSSAALLDLLPTLSADEWSAQTDCPGWTVKDVAAHLAHLEHALSIGDTNSPAPDATEVVSAYTEVGVAARRERSPEQLIAEFAEALRLRAGQLEILPEDAQALAPITPGGIQWSWDTLLRNRCIDVWVHEQDIRRAIDRPGGLDSAGAQVTTNTFKFAMAYVVGKKVRPDPGTSIGWRVLGEIPFDLTVVVGQDGRAKPGDAPPGGPNTLLTLATEEFNVLAAGRRSADRLGVVVEGDAALADSVLAAMSVTF